MEYLLIMVRNIFINVLKEKMSYVLYIYIPQIMQREQMVLIKRSLWFSPVIQSHSPKTSDVQGSRNQIWLLGEILGNIFGYHTELETTHTNAAGKNLCLAVGL